jgi:hypothetical protein
VQVIIDADAELVVAAARPVPGTTADVKAWRDSGLAEQCAGVTVLGDGAYINTGLIVPHRKRPGRPPSATAASAAPVSTTSSKPSPTCTTSPSRRDQNGPRTGLTCPPTAFCNTL